MAKTKTKKYYAVRVGKTPGVYPDWDACKAQVDGFPGAKFKAFPSENEAMAFAFPDESPEQGLTVSQTGDVSETKVMPQPEDDRLVAYVDGSFYDGHYAFGCIFYEKGKQAVSQSGGGTDPDLAVHRNVTGEMLGALQAAKTAVRNGYRKLVIIYDYAGIRHWALSEWKRNTKATQDYAKQMQGLMQMVDIEFVKVKGHTGCEGNELADKAAKAGLKSDTIPEPVDFAVSES